MTFNDLEKLISSDKMKVQKALDHLIYSLNKIKKSTPVIKIEDLDDLEKLEVWESFTSRFSRLSDMVSKRLIRSLILKSDPSFRGSFMDYLNAAEKLGYITNTNRWWAIRSLINKEAHEYTDEDLISFFQSVIDESSFLILETENLLQKI